MTPFVCWVSLFFLPHFLMLHCSFPCTCSWPPSVSLSIWLALVFPHSLALLAVSTSGDSDMILSYIVTRQYCDMFLWEISQISQSVLFLIQRRQVSAKQNQTIIYLIFKMDMWYQIQATWDFHSAMWSTSLSCSPATCEFIDRMRYDSSSDRCKQKQVLPCDTGEIYVSSQSEGLIYASCCDLVRRKLRGFN